MKRFKVRYDLNIYAETPGDAIVDARGILSDISRKPIDAVMREAINATFDSTRGTATATGTEHTKEAFGWSCMISVLPGSA